MQNPPCQLAINLWFYAGRKRIAKLAARYLVVSISTAALARPPTFVFNSNIGSTNAALFNSCSSSFGGAAVGNFTVYLEFECFTLVLCGGGNQRGVNELKLFPWFTTFLFATLWLDFRCFLSFAVKFRKLIVRR